MAAHRRASVADRHWPRRGTAATLPASVARSRDRGDDRQWLAVETRRGGASITPATVRSTPGMAGALRLVGVWLTDPAAGCSSIQGCSLVRGVIADLLCLLRLMGLGVCGRRGGCRHRL